MPVLRPVVASRFLVPVLAGALCTAPACKHEAPPQVGPASTADTAPVSVHVGVAAARVVPQTLSLTGTLVPDQSSDVTPLVGGRVDAVLVERGTVVHQGDPLVRLRNVDQRLAAQTAAAALEQSRARLGFGGGASGDAGAGGERFDPMRTAEVLSAQSNVATADDALQRLQQLSQGGAVSDQDLLRAQQQAQGAREQLRAAVNNARATYFAYQTARVQVDQMRQNVDNTVVRAPFDGEIAERKVDVGEFVGTQAAVVTLVRTDPLRVELQIPQELVPFVQRGQTVALHVDAFPDRPFTGTIRYISAAVRSDSRALVAEAVVPNADGALRPGVFVSAKVDLARQRNLVAVPTSAVLTEAGTNRVYVIVDGAVQERVVVVAERGTGEVLLERGVAANERVALDHLSQLGDGSRVTEAH